MTTRKRKPRVLPEGCMRHGSDHPKSKLEECQIPDIRRMLAEGKSWQKIADYYYVSKGAIARIATGRGWKHVN